MSFYIYIFEFQSGLAALTSESYSIWDEVNDQEKLARILAEQKPLWEIGKTNLQQVNNFKLYMLN